MKMPNEAFVALQVQVQLRMDRSRFTVRMEKNTIINK